MLCKMYNIVQHHTIYNIVQHHTMYNIVQHHIFYNIVPHHTIYNKLGDATRNSGKHGYTGGNCAEQRARATLATARHR